MIGPAAFAAAVFDMDGLLLDSERPIRDAWLQAAQELGVALAPADYLSVVGLNHIDSNARLLALFGAEPEVLGAARLRAQALLAERFSTRAFDVKPGARRLLQCLGAGAVPCAVASSTHRTEVQRRLTSAGLIDFFAAICGGDEVDRGKPAPDLYSLALARLGARARQTLAFEDSGHGVQAALAAGLAVVTVPDLKAPDPSWQARCMGVLPSLEAACDYCVQWFGIQCA
jgi:HAD superfamily hydrolase (TIGR01509 family)